MCGVELHIEGERKSDGARVEVPIYMEVRDNPSRTHNVNDPAVQHMLEQAQAAGLIDGDRISVGDLQEYAREGRVDFARPTPLVESDLPLLGSVVPVRGELNCHPENAHEEPPYEVIRLLGSDIECRPSGHYEAQDAYVANGHSGNIALSAGCGTVGALLRAVTPRQRFSHTGIFTDDLDTLRNSTASEDWLHAHQDSYRGISPENLRYARPGILRETVGDAYYGMTWHDDMESADRSYELQSFNMDPVRCEGDRGFTRPTLISPTLPRDDSAGERRRVNDQATLARRVAFVVDGMQGHYRFFGYSLGNIGLDRSMDWGVAGALRGDDGRNHATVCSSTLWTAAKSLATWSHDPGEDWENLTLEGELEAADLAFADPPTGISGAEEDGLYFYTEEERRAGAHLLFDNIYDGVGLTFSHWASDARENYANQITNCFASDECGQEARNNDHWRNTGGGVAVSPDDLLLWDDPWGHNEPLALRPAQYRQVYTWQRRTLGQGELLVKVVDSEGSDVVGAVTYVAGQYGRTDAEGKVLYLGVPAGFAEASATIWTGTAPDEHLLSGRLGRRELRPAQRLLRHPRERRGRLRPQLPALHRGARRMAVRRPRPHPRPASAARRLHRRAQPRRRPRSGRGHAMTRCTSSLFLLALFSLPACGSADPPRPTPDWASVCGRHCAGAPVQVAVGGHQVCLRYPGGAMICWGEVRGRADDVDPLLVTTEVDEETLAHDDPGRATTLVPGMLNVGDVSCGQSFCCAVRQDHGLWCWGMLNRWSAPGQQRAPDDPRVPRLVPGLDDVARVIGQGDEQLALSSLDQDLLALGDGAVVRTPASDWPHFPVTTAVAYSTTGPSLVADGHVYSMCLDNQHGQCGGGSDLYSSRVDYSPWPVFLLPVLDIDDAIDLASWDYTRCALRATGEVWCWGDAQVIWYQTVHEDGAVQRTTRRPTRVEALSDIVALKAGSKSFCALRADHQLFCWGIDTTGILHTRHADGERWQPYAVPDASDVVAFDLDDRSACVIRESGEVACSAQLPPDAPRRGHQRGDLVRVPNLPDLPADFAEEPTVVPTDVDGGVLAHHAPRRFRRRRRARGLYRGRRRRHFDWRSGTARPPPG